LSTRRLTTRIGCFALVLSIALAGYWALNGIWVAQCAGRTNLQLNSITTSITCGLAAAGLMILLPLILLGALAAALILFSRPTTGTSQ
jgi:hypothetical protein